VVSLRAHYGAPIVGGATVGMHLSQSVCNAREISWQV
jgi:hypothetical protein